MAEGIADCMPLALRSVGDAIRLDSENRTKEAYCQYLSCTIYISQVLKDDAWDKDLRQVYNSDTAKLYRLLQQCQERALTIVSSFANGASAAQKPESQKVQHLLPPADGVQRRYSDSSVVDTGRGELDQSHLAPQSGASRKLLDTTSSGSTLLAPAADGYLHLPSPPGSPTPRHRRTASYDPLEKAYQENKQLIAAYRTRMQNANKGRGKQDVMSRNLSLMRRMSENLVIAKAREQAIKKKLLERQQRLQEETNRRFGPAVLSTKEQQDQRILYTKILEFEQETVWPKHLRERLKLMPIDAKLIKEIITKIFCSADHPLTQFLLQYQYHVYRKLAPLVKDVGFPDVKSGRKATSKGTNIVVNEAHSNQLTEAINNIHVDEGDRGSKEQNTGSLNQGGEAVDNLSSESNIEGMLNETSKAVEDKCELEGHNTVENHEVASDEDGQNAKSNFDNEGVSSSTDIEKLKYLLGEEAPPDTSQAENVQVDDSTNGQHSSALKETDESSDLEIYFQELEDDMFGWESNREENDDNEKESAVTDDNDEKSLGENIEAGSTQIQEGRTEDLEETTDVKDEEVSSHLDSSESGIENSPDPAKSDDTHVCDEIEPSRENDFEPQDVDTNIVGQPQEDIDANPLQANQFISSQEEESTNDERGSSNANGNREAQQMEPNTNNTTPNINSSEEASETPDSLESPETPDEEKKSQADEGDTPMPKLPLFEESNSTIKQDNTTVPPTDEVREQLKDVLVDVRFFLEKLQKLLILAYEPLDTAAGRDLCYSFVEFPFFKPLWPMLLAVLRQVNYEKEVCLADVMSANISKSPLDLGVPQRLCMEDQEVLDSTGNTFPYQLAVEELHKVVTLFCPLEKLECLVRTSRCICHCVEDYWESKGKPRHSPETAIGCDDLLPILSFVIIRSGMAQLVSECDAMEEFIPEGYLMGEEGYCLTTLLTALAYLATLKPT